MCAFEPWEKKWPILTGENLLFSFFLSFLERPHQCPRCPLTLRDTSSVSEWQWWWLWEGRRHSHTREWNISCGFVSVHTVLIYRPGDLHTAGLTWLLKADGRENKNTLRAMHIENAHVCWKKRKPKDFTRLNVVHHYRNPKVLPISDSGGVESFSCFCGLLWVCLLTSPALVNCIKAVSGSMATFYNSYVNRERRSKARRTSAGEDLWYKTKFIYIYIKRNHQVRDLLIFFFFSLKCFSTTCRTQTAYP